MDMTLIHNSTKRNKESDEGRRNDFVNRINETPVSIDGARFETQKGLISTTSKGPNQTANVSYAPEPGAERDPTDDLPSGLHTLQQGSNSIRITSDVIYGGDGKVLKRNRWS